MTILEQYAVYFWCGGLVGSLQNLTLLYILLQKKLFIVKKAKQRLNIDQYTKQSY